MPVLNNMLPSSIPLTPALKQYTFSPDFVNGTHIVPIQCTSFYQYPVENKHISASERNTNCITWNAGGGTTMTQDNAFRLAADQRAACLDLDFFLSLKPGWDGYEALPVLPSLIAKIKDMIPLLIECPGVFPSFYQTISLEYHRGNAILQFECFDDRHCEVFQYVSEDDIVSDCIDLDAETINRYVSDFYGKKFER